MLRSLEQGKLNTRVIDMFPTFKLRFIVCRRNKTGGNRGDLTSDHFCRQLKSTEVEFYLI